MRIIGRDKPVFKTATFNISSLSEKSPACNISGSYLCGQDAQVEQSAAIILKHLQRLLPYSISAVFRTYINAYPCSAIGGTYIIQIHYAYRLSRTIAYKHKA